MTDIPWTVVGAFIGGIATVISALIVVLYKVSNKRLAEARGNVVELRQSLEKAMEGVRDHIKEHVLSFNDLSKEYFLAFDRLRDKWEGFLTNYLKIDNTRGQKIEALFRVVDSMDEVVKSIPHQMNNKVEDAFAHAMSELKLYARDLMSK